MILFKPTSSPGLWPSMHFLCYLCIRHTPGSLPSLSSTCNIQVPVTSWWRKSTGASKSDPSGTLCPALHLSFPPIKRVWLSALNLTLPVSLRFNYVWVPEGRREDGIQLVDGERRATGDVTHMPKSIRDWGGSAAPDLKRSSERGWGWRRARGDEKEMTDMRLNVAKINKVLTLG